MAFFLDAQTRKNAEKLEQIADWLFLAGLTVMGMVSVLIAFDLFLG